MRMHACMQRARAREFEFSWKIQNFPPIGQFQIKFLGRDTYDFVPRFFMYPCPRERTKNPPVYTHKAGKFKLAKLEMPIKYLLFVTEFAGDQKILHVTRPIAGGSNLLRGQ